ncbi:hypothetical protein HDU98_005187 [Podochytrium sp. JEL0797]|nr:hypothetical protein HDU98_005187 [Podochytrium sp. JEL0797]
MTLPETSHTTKTNPGKMRIFIDRGGTFTDCIAFLPTKDTTGFTTKVIKLLSEDPNNYKDAPTEAIRRIKEFYEERSIPREEKLDTSNIELIRMGTTVATNALLERKGEPVALFVTKGFKDILHIQNQARPHIFDLQIQMPGVLYEKVVEVDERVSLVGYTAHVKGVVREEDVMGREGFVKGVTGEWVRVLKKIDLEEVEKSLKEVLASGIRSIAICLMHSYTFNDHETQIAQLAKSLGFTHISTSSQTAPTIKLVPRGNSAVSDAYLTPSIKTYIDGFKSGFDEGIENGSVKVQFMKSDGGLADVNEFSGLGAILSGPAGGVVGYAITSYDEDEGTPVIGFDMGGTSTDVSRYAGRYDHVFETTTAGVTIQAPQLDINTVAAGGGSRLFFRNGMFVVGPESAGANPGPACYKKGGPLTITDANLVLGRLVPEYFPKIFGKGECDPLDLEATTTAFESLAGEINPPRRSTLPRMTIDEIAYGFVEVANEAMCRPIRQLTQAKGHDASKHVLACFGGAGGQHACAIAKRLGIKKVLVHRHSAILSAFGLSLADVVFEVQEPSQQVFDLGSISTLQTRLETLTQTARTHLTSQGFLPSQIEIEAYLNLRYHGTDTSIMTLKPADGWDFQKVFVANHLQEFGFILPGRDVVVDDIRVRAIGKGVGEVEGGSGGRVYKEVESMQRVRVEEGSASSVEMVYWGESGGRVSTPVFQLDKLGKGSEVIGPALIIDATATIVVEPRCVAVVTTEHVVILVDEKPASLGKRVSFVVEDVKQDPILLSVFGHRFMSIAEQMGRTLQKTAISTNIKERLDFSCALFGPDGGLVANAPHIPVHLGSMQEAVRWQMRERGEELRDGDVLMTNHPAAGGSHLPDITIITPVFNAGKVCFFVASRGHHADIGGIQPGSMPPNSTELKQEGAAVKSFLLVRDGTWDQEGLERILLEEPGRWEGCSGTRCLSDNLSDLKAQVAANQRGITLVHGLIQEYGIYVVQAYMQFIQENAELAVRNMLKSFHKKSGPLLRAQDRMDDGSVISLRIDINGTSGSAVFDFTGTSREVYGNINAPRSVTYSAIIYCLRCLINLDMPLNQGALHPITVVIPEGTLLSPSETAAVVGGNVLTSQRLCDVVLKAFSACAASQGCCNNFTFGSGGKDADGVVTDGFGYYETIAGGSGAGLGWDGRSGVHTHMTNTRITDPEILERRYPVLLRRFGLREGSGGEGKWKGGDGVVREIEFLETLNVSMLSERRVFQPYGLEGGEPGQSGMNLLIRNGHPPVNFGGKNSTIVRAGDVIRIETPGGGGYGVKEKGGGKKGKAAGKRKGEEAGSGSKGKRVRVAGGSLGNLEEAQMDF